MLVQLPKLPFDKRNLSSFLSEKAIDLHYQKHHKNYVQKSNELMPKKYHSLSCYEILKKAKGEFYNNFAQAWHHTFYWWCLQNSQTSQTSFEQLPASLRNQVTLLKDEFLKEAKSLFGSGWAWICMDDRRSIFVMTTKDGQVPFKKKTAYPLLTCDLWEHAYYVDYQNERPEYLTRFWSHINWGFFYHNHQERAVENLDLLESTSREGGHHNHDMIETRL